MKTYPNQKAFTIRKPRVNKNFLQVDNEQWMEACRTLKAGAFTLYLYLASNADNFTLMFSPAIATEKLGISESTIRRGIAELTEKGYIVDENGGNTRFIFYTTPVKMDTLDTNDTVSKMDTLCIQNEYSAPSKRIHDVSKMNTENRYTHNKQISTDNRAENLEEQSDSEKIFWEERGKELEEITNKQDLFRVLGELAPKLGWDWLNYAMAGRAAAFNKHGFGLLYKKDFQEEKMAELAEYKQFIEENYSA